MLTATEDGTLLRSMYRNLFPDFEHVRGGVDGHAAGGTDAVDSGSLSLLSQATNAEPAGIKPGPRTTNNTEEQ